MADRTQAKRKADPGEIVAVIRRVLAENGRDYIPHYAVAAVCMLAIAGTTAFSAWIMRDIVDEVFYRQRWELLWPICGAILAAFTIRGFATYGQAVLLARVGNNIVARYQRRIFDHLMKLGVGFFTLTRSGQLAAQISQNVTGVRDLLNMTLTSLARDAVTLVALVVVMVMQDPLLSVIALTIGPPLIFAVNYLMKRLRRATREAVEINSRLLGAIQESTQGIAIIKAFTMEEQLARRMGVLIEHAEGRANRIARVSERLAPITEVLSGFAIAGVIAYAGYRASTTAEPPGSVFAFITALLLAYDPARKLARVQVNLERALVNARMIYEILDIEPHQGDAADARPLAVADGRIRFDGVTFSYGEGLPVLRGVSFEAAPGRTTAIVGRSGAGKSTLVALLERFYDVDAGRITIDGQDIAGVTKRSLRQAIAYVSQQPYLFEGSIRDNIRYGRPGASDAEVEEAARLAHADDFIRRQPDGYDTMVGENGVTLSGGQRQRVSIARAILRDAPILLLDEATSALDNESEARVQAALEQVMRGRTTIVIAHRLSTVVNADHIVVMEDGEVVEEGTHGALVARPGGVYARFHRMQGKPGDLLDPAPADRAVVRPQPQTAGQEGDTG
ncbi:ABC transporter ATP-binding protein/permease [Aquibium sp. A9E412]|uniref:ABC transporter ATP-binding protein n=1 Tax=Aquibium sp. A9E412 TaxID=2976767 RepID=UPI0025B275D3|nr:ABC transporter ATP-binding protein [Aquibium sp. A9E412]MDN2567097.1 ABC transporter ATP-binding protein/permease [Aquibium sp. A9E412]